ncbi:hypothetical protein WMF28_08870 [Sorangium sp. So ce590]|uniref:hypothetical protein n=1 Tax=Sorangium sp. So ce590 TaxID=3133317 RepID=UPI003F5E2D79
MFTLLAGTACLTVSGCRRGLAIDPQRPGEAAEGAPEFPFAARGHELFKLPSTWYCVSPWSEDRDQERRGMELFAWRQFIALNWPGRIPNPGRWRAERGLDKLNERDVYPRWNSWYTPQTIYSDLTDDSSDDSPERGAPLGWSCDGDCLTNGLNRSGRRASTPHRLVYDQNGQAVLYEVRLDESWHKTLMRALESSEVAEEPEEVRERSGTSIDISFTHGQCRFQGPDAGGDSYDLTGATAIKLAWKTLTEEESTSGRFLQRRASPRPSGPGAGDGITLGLVGFHIAQKSKPYGKWIWSTFEQVDNLAPAETPSGPSFNDTGCDPSTCRPNASKQVQVRGSTMCRTQITRIDPIPLEVQRLNAQARAWLKSSNTVLQHYQLIGVQYNPYNGSKAEPETLRNPVIETYIVGSTTSHRDASQDPCAVEPEATRSSCLGCHSAVQKHDFSFVPTRSLCNCEENRWIGDDYCERLGVSNECKTEAPGRRAADR